MRGLKQYSGIDNNHQPVLNMQQAQLWLGQAKLGHFQEKHLANENKKIVTI